MRRAFGGFERVSILSALAIGVLGGCSSSSAPDDGGADATTAGDSPSGAEASTICDEFTEAGAPCPGASPLRCFPLCDAGGCYCRVTPGGGPHWVCVTDTTCLPDCAPIDPTCGSDAGSD
jgi:hypothetical protein